MFNMFWLRVPKHGKSSSGKFCDTEFIRKLWEILVFTGQGCLSVSFFFFFVKGSPTEHDIC